MTPNSREPQPDLHDLALFALVADLGSMGRAAEHVGLAQPTVSRRMHALERALGVQLLQRSRRGTSLTASGRVVADWASILLSSARDFMRSVETMSQRGDETLQVAVSMTIAEHRAPQWFAKLQARSSKTEVSMLVSNSAEVADLVASGSADIGFVETPKTHSKMHRRRIGGDRLVVAVAPSHPWARRRRPVRPEDLAQTRLLVREAGSGTRETLETALRREHLSLHPGYVMASNSALRSAAAAGMGAVVLSEMALVSDLANGTLVEITVEGLDLRRPFTAIWRVDTPVRGGLAQLLAVVDDDSG